MANGRERAIIEIVTDVNDALADFKKFEARWREITARMDAAADEIEFDKTSASIRKLKADAANTFEGLQASAQRAGTSIEELSRHSKTSTSAQKELQAEVQRLKKALLEAESGVKRFGAAGAKETERVKKSVSGLSATVGNLKGLFAGLSIAFLGRAAFQALSSFSLRMAELQAVTSATKEEMQAATDVAIQLGESTIFSSTQAAEAMTGLGRAGFTVQETLAAIPGLLALAASANLDLASAVDIAANTLRAFNLAAEESSRVADVLAKGAASANTNVQQLGEAMKFVAPFAAGLNVSLEETTAALGILADRGLQASLGGTSLRATLASLASPTTKVRSVVANLGLTMDDVNIQTRSLSEVLESLVNAGLGVQEALEIAGKRGGAGLQVLAQNVDSLRELTAELENAGGAALRMSEIMQDSVSGAAKKFTSALDGLVQRTGERGLAGALKALLALLAEFVKRLDGVINTLGGVAALVFTPLIALSEAIVKSFNAIIQVGSKLASAINLDGVAETLADVGRETEFASDVLEEYRKNTARSVGEIGRGLKQIALGATEAQTITIESVNEQVAALRRYVDQVEEGGEATREQADRIIAETSRIIAGINALPDAERRARQAMVDDLKAIREAYRETGQTIIDTNEEAIQEALKLNEAVSSFIESVAGGDIKLKVDAMRTAVEELRNEGRLTAEVEARVREEITKLVNEAAKLGQTIPELQKFAAEFGVVAEKAKNAAAGVKSVGEESTKSATEAERLAEKLGLAVDQVERLKSAQQRKTGLEKSVSDLTGEIEELRAKNVLTIEESNRLADAQAELATAEQDLAAATRAVTSEYGLNEQGARKLFDTTSKLREGMLETLVEMGAITEQSAAWAAQWEELNDPMTDVSESLTKAQAGAAKFSGEVSDAAVVLERMEDGSLRLSNATAEAGREMNDAAVIAERLEDGQIRLRNETELLEVGIFRLADGTLKMVQFQSRAREAAIALADEQKKLGEQAEETSEKLTTGLTQVNTQLRETLSLSERVVEKFRELGDTGGGGGGGF